MKIEEVKVESTLVDIEVTNSYSPPTDLISNSEYRYSFRLDKYVGGEITLYVKKEIPESMYEFKQLHGLDNKGLLEWLNNNYKKQ